MYKAKGVSNGLHCKLFNLSRSITGPGRTDYIVVRYVWAFQTPSFINIDPFVDLKPPCGKSVRSMRSL